MLVSKRSWSENNTVFFVFVGASPVCDWLLVSPQTSNQRLMFSKNDKEVLINLVMKNKDILESKKTDALSLNKKKRHGINSAESITAYAAFIHETLTGSASAGRT